MDAVDSLPSNLAGQPNDKYQRLMNGAMLPGPCGLMSNLKQFVVGQTETRQGKR